MDDFGDPYFSGGNNSFGSYFDDPYWSGSPDTGSPDMGYDPYGPGSGWGEDTLSNMGATNDTEYASDPYGPGSGWGKDTLSAMGATNDTDPSFFDKLIGGLRGLGNKGGGAGGGLGGLGSALAGLASSKSGLAGLGMLLAYLDKQKPTGPKGGGTTMAYGGPKGAAPPTIEQGRYGPIARFAANGGIMHAYREGGKVQMEDGGFVLTKRAVDGAGGEDGVAGLVPGAKMIYGPGTGTSDDIPAQINGRHSVAEARLSNGEAYVPPEDVENNGGIRKMYATMRQLERRA